MTLRHLKIFVAVCECDGITAAAEKMYLAQPAVSLAIRELEEYYGIRLFDRISRHLYLTEAGKQFLEYALHITSLFDEMESGIRNWDSIGHLRIGSSITIGTHLMPELVKHFSSQYPDIKVHVTINNSKQIENMVLNNQLDFALIEGVVHSEHLLFEEFLSDELVLVCSPDDPLTKQQNIEIEELKKYPFLLREVESGTRELFDSCLLVYGISIEPIWESTSTGALIHAVKKGLGLSALPYPLVKRDLDAGDLERLFVQGLDFHRKFHVIYHKNKYLTKAARSFIDISQDCRFFNTSGYET